MKYQVLFSLKNNEKVFINVVCCSRYVPFKCDTNCEAMNSACICVRQLFDIFACAQNIAHT